MSAHLLVLFLAVYVVRRILLPVLDAPKGQSLKLIKILKCGRFETMVHNPRLLLRLSEHKA